MTTHVTLSQFPEQERLELALTAKGFELAQRLLASRGQPETLPTLERNVWPIVAVQGDAREQVRLLERLLEDEIVSGEWTIVPGNLVEMHGSYLLIPGNHAALLTGMIAGESKAQSQYASLPVYYDEDWARRDPVAALLERPLVLRSFNAASMDVSDHLLRLTRTLKRASADIERRHHDHAAATRLRLAVQDVADLMTDLAGVRDVGEQFNDLMAWE